MNAGVVVDRGDGHEFELLAPPVGCVSLAYPPSFCDDRGEFFFSFALYYNNIKKIRTLSLFTALKLCEHLVSSLKKRNFSRLN